MMRSAHSAASATDMTLKPGRLRLLRRGRAGAERDRHVLDAGIAEVLRMRVALAAIADDRDLLGLDQVEVGIPVVIDAHVSPFRWSRFAGPLVS